MPACKIIPLLVIWLFWVLLQLIEITAPLPSVLQTPEEAKEIGAMEQTA